MLINLTQHPVTPEQAKDGVVDLPPRLRGALLLTLACRMGAPPAKGNRWGWHLSGGLGQTKETPMIAKPKTTGMSHRTMLELEQMAEDGRKAQAEIERRDEAWRHVTEWNAEMSNANLSGADLSKANLAGADLSKANLAGADLSKANLAGADLSNVHWNGADLSRATWPKPR